MNREPILNSNNCMIENLTSSFVKLVEHINTQAYRQHSFDKMIFSKRLTYFLFHKQEKYSEVTSKWCLSDKGNLKIPRVQAD